MASAPDSPTQRFSDRVPEYIRYRPSYPAGVIEHLRLHARLGSGAVVADLGSGTGLFSRLLLATGAQVHAVEPNDAMRAAAERDLADQPGFTSVAGTAEETGLPDQSIALVTAAQAFHWFDGPACRRECQRLLRPSGQVALVWNERQSNTTAFLAGYEALLLRHATDYARINHRNITGAKLAAFYGPTGYTTTEFPSEQRFDLPGLQGRLMSSSYAPKAGHPSHAPMFAELAELFVRHAEGGQIAFRYTTKLYLGALESEARS
jgi:ubiquinone/menaquinone biosynthesis C-methylase UbiE